MISDGEPKMLKFGTLLSERFTETLNRTRIPSGVILPKTEKLTSKTHCLSHQMKLDAVKNDLVNQTFNNIIFYFFVRKFLLHCGHS